MDVRACRTCKKLFNYFSGPDICPDCKDALERKFREVKDYIRDNKTASIQETAEACEVSVNTIKQWIREERLQFAEDSGVGFACEACGKTIYTGRYCEECKKKVAAGFTEAIAKDKPALEEPKRKTDDRNKMRFI